MTEEGEGSNDVEKKKRKSEGKVKVNFSTEQHSSVLYVDTGSQTAELLVMDKKKDLIVQR